MICGNKPDQRTGRFPLPSGSSRLVFSSPIEVVAISTLMPLVTFIKTQALTKLAEGATEAVGGRLFTALEPKLRKLVGDRFTAGHLPANHDLAKASRAALGSALRWMAHELGGQVPPEFRGELLRRFDRHGFASQVPQFVLPPACRSWLQALIELSKDDEQLRKLDVCQLSGAELERLLQTHSDSDAGKRLHERVLAWIKVQLAGKGTAPEQLDDFVHHGCLVDDARVTLYDAWCIYFRERIKDESKVFNSFVATALADLLERRDAAPPSQDFVEAFGRQLTGRLDQLFVLADETLRLTQGIDKTTERIDEATRRLEDKLDKLQALPVPEPFDWPRPMNFDSYVKGHLASFTGREWLIARFFGWLRAPGARQVMLIEAPFGVGKTAFMSKLASTLAHEQIRCVIHFCRFDEQDTLQPGRIVRSLAAQLKALIPEYQAVVERSPEARKALDAAGSDPAAAWTRAVVDPLVDLGRPDDSVPLVLLIDGLDESQELHGANLAPDESLLEMIVRGTTSRLPRWIRIVISARDDLPQLREQAVRFEVIHMLEELSTANRRDLEAFIRACAQEPRFQQLIGAAGMGVSEFVKELADLCDDKFLLARYLAEDVASLLFQVEDLLAVLRLDRGVSNMDAYYGWVFQKRLKHVVMDKAKTEAVLGVIAAALTPLSARAIAAVLCEESVLEEDVNDVVVAFGGLLTRDQSRGITFDHLSIEQWLDRSSSRSKTGNQIAKGTGFDIDREKSMARLQQHCLRMAKQPLSALSKGDFTRYLSKHGVVHLIDAAEIADALDLLMRLPLEVPPTPRASAAKASMAAGPPRRMETRVIDAIHRALQAFDEAFNRGENPPDGALAELDAEHLHRLLKSRDYETGKYGPVIRTLVQFKRIDNQVFKARYADELADDLVFRNDFGVAHADAWFYSRGSERDRLLAAIVEMAKAEDADDREIAGYALKHLCQKIDPRPWWKDIEPTIRELAARYAFADAAVDRMVGGEMLLALAIQDVPVRDWFAGREGADRFWRPYWPNLRMDIEAICAYAGEEPAPQAPLPGDDFQSSFAAAREQGRRADEMAAGFAKHPLFDANRKGPKLWRLQWAVGSLKDQQCDKVALDESLDDLSQLVDSPEHKRLVLDVICRLMLHPSWDLTEAGASLVADLIKRKGRIGGPWWLIDELLKSHHWRLVYGAVDAAYNAGGVDGYKKFRQIVLKAGEMDQCRVRGICADDLRMWLKQANPASRIEILGDADIRKLLRCWLETANDIWLLEYLHLLFSELWGDGKGDESMRDLVRGLMQGGLSHYLTLDPDRPFYEQEAEDFLAAIESQRKSEWEAIN
jgi:NACHT domain